MIREGRPEDLDRISFLENLCFSDPWSRKMLEEYIGRPGKSLLVDEEDGVLAGYACMERVLEEGNIDNVSVAPEFRRRGIGRALLMNFLDRGKNNGLETCFLEVRRGNLPAIRLYESLGFRPVRVRKEYYRDPVEDAVVYRLEIKGE